MKYSKMMDIGSRFHAEMTGIAIGMYEDELILACETCNIAIKVRTGVCNTKEFLVQQVTAGVIQFASLVVANNCTHMKGDLTFQQINRVLKKYYDTEISRKIE